jgi:hypothetical protein
MTPNDTKDHPLPPYHSNVASGATVEQMKRDGLRFDGTIHHFGMTWACGHHGDAVAVGDRFGTYKACRACWESAPPH